MLDRFFRENPSIASILGLHDPYDYQLPKGDTAHLLRNLGLFEEWVRRMKETMEYEDLSDVNKTDWRVLERAVEMGNFKFHEQRQHELDPNAFEMLGTIFFMMITRDYAPLEKRIDAAISRIEKVPRFLEEFRTRFEGSRPVRLWTEIAIESGNQMPELFRFMIDSAKVRISDELHNRLSGAVDGLQKPLREHMEWLEGLLSNSKENWALGREKFERLLEIRGLGMTAEEILHLGRRYLEELKGERADLAHRIDPDKGIGEVIRDIEADAPRTFEEALEETRRTMEEAKRFIVENDIATVYEEDRLLVEETPAFLTPVMPFAALFMPSRFDRPMIGTYVVTRPKDVSNLGKHHNYASLKNVAVHEAFPGHFLQGIVSNRSSLVHIFAEGIETVEGWAHYCEEMMVERGFVTSLESKLIQVRDAIWRAVRIILDVKLSRGEMGFDEAVDMLIREAGLSREAAIAEVRRYTQSPGYPLSYLLGKHLILQLRDDIKGRMGDRYSDKFFHDTITANGELPISLIREVLDRKVAELTS